MYGELYGKQNLTINMHLHGHLKECILDLIQYILFGSVSSDLMEYSAPITQTGMNVTFFFFLSNDSYCFNRWPAEYVDQFSPLL